MTKRTPKLSPEVQRERALILSALDTVVPMLGAMVGDHIEVVLHDLTHPERSVLRIANGHVTGRQPGSPVLAGPGNDKALAILAEGKALAQPQEHVTVFPYPTFARDGCAMALPAQAGRCGVQVDALRQVREELAHLLAAFDGCGGGRHGVLIFS